MGRVRCAVPGCGSDELSQGVSFHRFPSSSGRRKMWMDALALLNEPRRLVCSVHFEKTCFDGVPQMLRDAGYTRRRLRRDAVPTRGVRNPQPAAACGYGQHCTNGQDVPAELQLEEPSTEEPVVDRLETSQSSKFPQVAAIVEITCLFGPDFATPCFDLQGSSSNECGQRNFSASQHDYSSKQDAEAQTDADPVSTVKPKAVQVGLGANMHTSRATQTAMPPSRATQTAILLEYRSTYGTMSSDSLTRNNPLSTSQRSEEFGSMKCKRMMAKPPSITVPSSTHVIRVPRQRRCC